MHQPPKASVHQCKNKYNNWGWKEEEGTKKVQEVSSRGAWHTNWSASLRFRRGRTSRRNCQVRQRSCLSTYVSRKVHQTMHYVAGKVFAVDWVDSQVDSYRESRKMANKFVHPVVADISSVSKWQIVMCLPKPFVKGGTKKVTLQFPVDVRQYSCQ